MISLRYLQVLLIVVCGLVVGCKFFPQQPSTKSANGNTASAKPVQSPVPPLSATQKTINSLLAEADYALSQDRLLMPLEDNAFDRFQSVLLLEPGNKLAQTGLQSVALRYIELARASIHRGQFAQAQAHINNARSIDPNSPLTDETQSLLRRAKASQPPVPAYKPGPNEHLLNAQELTRKSPAVITQLAQLAKKAQSSGNLVMIYARNDAEGRWIYSQMRDALGDYLLRGDIRIASQPRIQFVSAL